MIPLTVPEVRRLLLVLAEPAGAERDQRLAWSRWRRQHQAAARRGHRARRARRPPPAQPGPLMPGPIPVLSVPGTAALSEALWQEIAPLLAPPTTPPLPRGRPAGNLRRQVEGMLTVMQTGAPWREVPAACGPWPTIYTRYRSWVTTGLWDRIAAILHPSTSPEERSPPS